MTILRPLFYERCVDGEREKRYLLKPAASERVLGQSLHWRLRTSTLGASWVSVQRCVHHHLASAPSPVVRICLWRMQKI